MKEGESVQIVTIIRDEIKGLEGRLTAHLDKLETKVEDRFQNMDKQIRDLDNKTALEFSSLDSKYASKNIEKAVYFLLITIAGSVTVAILPAVLSFISTALSK